MSLTNATIVQASSQTQYRHKGGRMLPLIDVGKANALVEKATTSPPVTPRRPSVASRSTLTLVEFRGGRGELHPQRVQSVRPTSLDRVGRTPTQARPRVHRRAASVPVPLSASVAPPRPLSDGPMGWTYTPLAARSGTLECFLPPTHYSQKKRGVKWLIERAEKVKGFFRRGREYLRSKRGSRVKSDSL
ncbi:hypothetical protein BU23DRAFT_564783 [Bimuria novae-zelandiae CBS 107.79]|uniref:Uncharacterized protein n=1 Tax=Bimuria novae-zelandiae CBS 107.79 TaxID=1447943 RepID=A0A6A5VSS7_9PLEO|nr:hypothetical protein BU23DRAFT_564783 [Bimuria novae-zelandiae CBS 107.79]